MNPTSPLMKPFYVPFSSHMNTNAFSFSSGLRICLVLAFSLVCSALNAQESSLRSQIASLSQRFDDLERRHSLLTLEIDNLKSENARLRAIVSAASSTEQQTRMDAAIASANEAQWKRTQAYVQEQFDKLLTLITRRLDATVEGISRSTQLQSSLPPAGPATIQPTQVFTNDFPKEGVRYKVMPGDTLSSIAQKHGTTIRHIQNANRIADPNDLKAGSEIFVPVPAK